MMAKDDSENGMIDFAMDPTPEKAKGISTYRLHEAIRHEERGQYHVRAIAEAELRRREAWAAPAGRAFWISIVSAAIAFVALLVSIVNAI